MTVPNSPCPCCERCEQRFAFYLHFTSATEGPKFPFIPSVLIVCGVQVFISSVFLAFLFCDWSGATPWNGNHSSLKRLVLLKHCIGWIAAFWFYNQDCLLGGLWDPEWIPHSVCRLVVFPCPLILPTITDCHFTPFPCSHLLCFLRPPAPASLWADDSASVF